MFAFLFQLGKKKAVSYVTYLNKAKPKGDIFPIWAKRYA